jgi:hypothetical protein
VVCACSVPDEPAELRKRQVYWYIDEMRLQKLDETVGSTVSKAWLCDSGGWLGTATACIYTEQLGQKRSS